MNKNSLNIPLGDRSYDVVFVDGFFLSTDFDAVESSDAALVVTNDAVAPL